MTKTTKTTAETLSEMIEKARVIKKLRGTELATELRKEFERVKAEVKGDRTLSELGRKEKIEAAQKELAIQTLEHSKLIKDDYLKVVQEAREIAYKVKTTQHDKPKNEMQVKIFEQDLESLKTSVMLGLSASASLRAVEAFASKYGEEKYFVQTLKANYSTLASSILGIEANPQNRQRLSTLLERISLKASTPDTVKADEVLQRFEDAENHNMFLTDGIQFDSIRSVIGNIAVRLNDPETALNELAEVEAGATE